MSKRTFLAALAFAVGLSSPALHAADSLLNASYDIARELFAQINPVFVKHWEEQAGQKVEVRQSHGGTSRQARAIIEGLQADVVTFNQVTDIDLLHKQGNLVAANWAERLPHNSSPWYSAPAFLVRKGNPKNIQDWDDLVREDVRVIFPNPKTSGNARYSYLGAWTYAHRHFQGDEAKIRDFVQRVLANVPVFDTGGRGATTTFVERRLGDVLITFESEVHNIRREYGDGEFEVVVPSMSVLAEFPVSVVDKVVDRRGSRELAEAYLNFLYSDAVQEIAAENWYRVRSEEVAKRYADRFPQMELVRVEDVLGSWDEINATHFASDGVLDQLMVRGRRR